MEQTGAYRIAAPREAVWRALNDPEVLGRCIPGCQSVTKTADDAFSAKVKAKIGPVSATFDADLTLTDITAPERYTIVGGVKGGAAGFGKGQAEVSLAETAPEETLLEYQVKASVGGKLAQIGSRLVDGAARKMADDFFGAFSQEFGSEEAPVAAETEAATEPTAATTNTHTEREPQGSGAIWIIAFAVLALALILAF